MSTHVGIRGYLSEVQWQTTYMHISLYGVVWLFNLGQVSIVMYQWSW